MPRQEHLAWIGLGSNQGDCVGQLRAALIQLDRQPGLHLVDCSSLYRTPPWGISNQPEFINAVARFTSRLEPRATLAVLHDVETQLGRRREATRWGPRVIDLDLLLWDDSICHMPGLCIPHPRMHRRLFVLEPLAELDPCVMIPGKGTAADCLHRLLLEDAGGRGQRLEQSIEMPCKATRPE